MKGESKAGSLMPENLHASPIYPVTALHLEESFSHLEV